MALTPFTLAAAPGGSTLTLGEHVFEGVTVTVAVDGAGIPQLTAVVSAAGAIHGEGVVTVVTEPTELDILTALAEWLEALDPGGVIPLVDARLVSMSQHPVAETLLVLAELAREAAHG